MRGTLIILFLISFSNSSFAYSLEDVNEWQLEFIFSWNGSSWNTKLSPEDPYYKDEVTTLFIERKNRRGAKLIETSPSNKRKEIPWSLVRGLRIIIKNETKTCPDQPLFLSSFKELDDCPIDSISSLEINYDNYECRFTADIDSFTWLNHPSKSKSLTELIMMGDQAPLLKIKSLKKHPIIALEITTPLGIDLREFENLKILRMPGIHSSFNYHASLLPNLVDISEPDGIYRNRFHHEHAERYFWLRYLPSINMPINEPIVIENYGYFFHPLNWLLHLTALEFPDRIKREGELYVVEDDLKEETRYEHQGDTLLHGYMNGDSLKGVWTFRVSEQYAFNDKEAFHLDLDAELISVSENGTWQLKYLSGKTAISGSLKEGLKEGEWLFYKESGELVCRRYFVADTLKRTVVNFYMRETPLVSRAYYISANESIQAFEHNGEVRFMYVDLWPMEKDPIVITKNSLALLGENGSYIYYGRNHPNFETIYRENVIDKVYPEFIGQDFPFEY